MNGKTLLDHIAVVALINSWWICYNINPNQLSGTLIFLGIVLPVAYLIIRLGFWVIQEWE